MTIHSRRSFLAFVPTTLVAASQAGQGGGAPEAPQLTSFPTQEPDLVREMVTVSHFNLARVKELVGRHQTLAKAAWDWGFGDWESALGAASHIGNRDIAEFLLANGARPTIFSAAMLGQVDVVKAFVTGSPGVQRTKGPHSITLLRHAVAGGPRAQAVVDYLKSVGGADEQPPEERLTDEQIARLTGTYVAPLPGSDRIEVTVTKGTLMFARTGRVARGLVHLGNLDFFPVGAENVRIRFADANGVSLTVHDPDVVLTARKQ